MTSRTVLLATSNPGKLRDFAGAAAPYGITIANIPHFSSLPEVVEDGTTFEENARKKAESYSLAVPGELVLADDSGLEIDALGGAPGVHSARYAADEPHTAERNTDDEANNARVLRELKGVPGTKAHRAFRLRAGRGPRRPDAAHLPRRRGGRHPGRAPRPKRFRIRPAVLFPANRQNLCRTERRRKGAVQPSWRSFPRIPVVVSGSRLTEALTAEYAEIAEEIQVLCVRDSAFCPSPPSISLRSQRSLR